MATGRVPTTANSPLTAKGDLFGYSTTQARVAVGNDGETLVADSSTSTGLRYTGLFGANKNKIINGDFFVNQRSFSSTTTSGTFGFDRWFTGFAGGTVTYSNQAFTPGAAPVAGYEGSTFARLVSASQSAAGDYATLQQKIEDVRTFAGQTITYSFWAKASSGTPNIGVTMVQDLGVGGTGGNTITSPAVKTITTSWARYSFTIAMPSLTGKTIGTSSKIETIIFTSNGATLQALGYAAVGVQNATIDIWGVQAEAGSVATPFQTATGTIQGELAACQRYYQSYGAYDLTGDLYASGGGVFFKDLLCTMRTTPTVTYPAGPYTNDLDQFLVGSTTPTALASATFTANSFTFYASGGSGLTGGFPCTWTGSTIQLSAEL